MNKSALLIIALTITFTYATPLVAGFRVRPASGESGGAGHDENEGNEQDDHGNGNGNDHDNDHNKGGEQEHDPMMEMIRQIMKKFDRNRDGVLSYREAPRKIKKMFYQIDSNRDGKIDLEELKKMLKEKPEDDNRPLHPRRRSGPRDNSPRPQY